MRLASLTMCACALLSACGGFAVLWAARGHLARFARERAERFERELRFLKLGGYGRAVAGAQFFSVAAGVGLLVEQVGVGLSLAAIGLCAPEFALRRARSARIVQLEQQVEGWLGALGRALEAAPSLGEAIRVSATMTLPPLRDELEQSLNEMQLGLSVDDALAGLERRIDSATLSSALTALRVGQKTGGNLPVILKRTAQSLRELERLEGVLRTKTAEGRTQALVISLVPAPLYALLRWMDPSFFSPLETTTIGHIVLAVAIVLWAAAALLARRILNVQF